MSIPGLPKDTNVDKKDEVEVMREFLVALNTMGDPKTLLKKLKSDWILHKFKYPPMHWAAREGKIKFLAYLASLGEDINMQWGDTKQTPLMEAIRLDRPESIAELLKLGANIKLENLQKKTAAYYAVMSNDEESLQKILKAGADIHNIIEDQTLLMLASHKGFYRIANILIQNGAKVNQEGPGGYTALMYAARHGHQELVELLIEHGAHINQATHSQFQQIPPKTTALMRAAVFGHNHVVQSLIAAGANSDLQDDNGKTALMHAAENNKKITMAILLKNNADENLLNKQGKAAIDMLKSKATEDSIADIRRAAIQVRERRNAIAGTNRNVLLNDWLKKSENIGNEKILIGKLLKIANFKDKAITKVALDTLKGNWKKLKTNLTPLTWAVNIGNIALIGKLIELGFDVNESDKNGNTPLIESAKKLDVHSTITLLNAGADSNIRNRFSQKPYEIIENREANNVIEKLQLKEIKGLLLTTGQKQNNFTNHIYEHIYEDVVRPSELNADTTFIKKASHSLGLSFQVTFPASKSATMNGVTLQEPYQILEKSEGTYGMEGIHFLDAKLKKYKKCNLELANKLKTPWSSIKNAFDFRVKLDPSSHWENVTRYKNNEMVIIPAGWTGHAVSLVFYKNKLIITNRGIHGDQSFGSKIYSIPDNKLHLIDNSLFHEINNCRYQKSIHLHKVLDRLVDIENPLAKFPSKGQKHGTCGFVNHKSSIEAMLYLLALDNRNISEEKAKQYARKQYKEFTHFIREDEVNEIIKTIQDEKNKAKFDLYIQLVKQIIIEHHSTPDQKEEKESPIRVKNVEMDRTLRLINALPKSYLDAIKKDPNLVEPLKICLDYQANTKLKKADQVNFKPSFSIEKRKNLIKIYERLRNFVSGIDETSSLQALFNRNQIERKQVAENMLNLLKYVLQDNNKADLEKLFLQEVTSDDLTLLEIYKFIEKEMKRNQKTNSMLTDSNSVNTLDAILKDIKKEFELKLELKSVHKP